MLLSDKAKMLVDEKYNNFKEKRLLHIYGVAEMAEYLAKIYNIDVEKAKCAAYMHDYCKYDDPKILEKSMPVDDICECQKYPFLYHAYGSAYAYKEFFSDEFDIDIYNAIRNHVFGRINMSALEQIIMISDYTEKTREYPQCIECREILLNGDFDKAILKSLEYTIAHVRENGDLPHPRQIDVYNEYLKKVNEGENK